MPSPVSPEAERLDALLERTSRTFALAIPLLPPPLRTEVTVAYLLFRIADTFEDAQSWPAARRVEALEAFSALLHRPSPAAARDLGKRWREGAPIDHAGYQELLAETEIVLATFERLDREARRIIRDHVVRTNEGMASFVRRTNAEGRLVLRDVDDLRAYCYVVAGIVGEMLTELFLRSAPELLPHALVLRERAREFGEALQLVNILKDSASDATEGRRYLPPRVARPEVFSLARRDLARAGEYVQVVQDAAAPRGLVSFVALPVLLARASLDRIEERGPGSKLTRAEVFAILAAMGAALESGEPVLGQQVHGS